MDTYQPTNSELVATLDEHIHYEINQLITSFFQGPAKSPVIKNALLESMLIHTRNLADFFEKDKRSKRNNKENDDVISIDYGFPSKADLITKDKRTKINKYLAHLTFSRGKSLPSDREWPFDEIFLPIIKRCKEFCEFIIENYLPKNSPKEIDKWKETISKIDNIYEISNLTNRSSGLAEARR